MTPSQTGKISLKFSFSFLGRASHHSFFNVDFTQYKVFWLFCALWRWYVKKNNNEEFYMLEIDVTCFVLLSLIKKGLQIG